MPTDHREQLRQIRTFPSLVKYLRDELDWPIESASFEDLYFEYEAEELGIDPKTAANIRIIRQLRPLVTDQPWGIFFVEFEPKRLPVVALRRILGQLVFKKRANKAERPAWNMHDLLFISSYGEGSDREICLAHFSEDPQTDRLATLKVLGWDGEDTGLHLDHVHHELQTKLRWPGNQDDAADWRETWSSAFTLRHREVITTSKDLATTLADLAGKIRKKVNAAIKIESDKGKLRKLLKAFQESLIHDLDEDDFADMYAQTIAYGLLSAAISRASGALVADDVAQMVPLTSPFLRELMEKFLHLGGRKRNGNGDVLDFDELGINDVVETLRAANMEAVLRDFDNRNPQEDPVIHFYELFLREYDAKKRLRRGVFYTPKPVVSYIIHSVHELLQTEFGLEDGLADTTTWGEMAARLPSPSGRGAGGEGGGFTIPEGVSPDTPFVQILDPALGTGTFLVEVIEVIHQTMTAKWRAAGHNDKKINNLWNDYVPKHLLSRLYGFELLMAPYAIAHMKIGLKLAETGYRFRSDERARVYLTNSLEPAMPEIQQKQIAEMSTALAHEAKAVNHVKRHQRFTVVIGNPPYSGVSANNSDSAVRLVDAYKFVDGEPLGERKHWLQDDYKKFVRIAQIKIETAGAGIVGYITNHGFLDDPTARGMRQSLMLSFPLTHLLDSHGSLKKREVCPDGTTDQNVFDIEPGVAIGLFHKPAGASSAGQVKHAHLWGLESAKHRYLASHTLSTTDWTVLQPKPRFYLFTPSDISRTVEYERGVRLIDVFPVSSVGCVTARDSLTIHWNPASVWKTVTDFASLSVETARTKYDLGKDVRDWTVEGAQRDVRASGPTKTVIAPVLYRPFDQRFTYYTGQSRGFIGQPQPKVARQFMRGENLGLSIGRQGQAADTDEWSVVFCTKFFTEFNLFRRGGNNLNPLYVYPADEDSQRLLTSTSRRAPNLSPLFLGLLAQTLGISQAGEHGLPTGLTPEDIFHYIYAVFHSPGYRSRYAEFLKIDFPRLPLTGSLELFRELARLGGELVGFHLLESPKLDKFVTTYSGPAKPEVVRVNWSQDAVWLDAPAARRGQPARPGTIGFRGVPEAVWNFHIGGYQICQKWLKDRKGRTLSKDDLAHYQKIVVALSETIRIMAEIDEVIEQHGGWPGAFCHQIDWQPDRRRASRGHH